jgi:hypothetical protein
MTSAAQTKLIFDLVSVILKDLYSAGKDAVHISYNKWTNRKNISQLVNKLHNYEKVKTIWQRDKEVTLSEFYYPSKVHFDRSKHDAQTINSLNDIPKNASYVIEGTVGQGKSIFLRYLCIQELSSLSSERIPIFLELRKLESSCPLKDALYTVFKNLGFEINDHLFDYYAKSGKIVILLDGFDELDETITRSTINQIEDWVERYEACQFIITTRPNSDISQSRHLKTITLASLSEKDFKPFLVKIGVRGPAINALLLAIKNSSNKIQGLLKTPLLLTLLVLVYQAEQEIPSELPDFFDKLFTTVFSKHDRTKPGYIRKHRTGLSESKFEALFKAFCFYVMRNNYSTSLSKEQFSNSYQEAASFTSNTCDESHFKYDVTKSVCLMQEEGFNIVFIHKSILDYFSASFLKNRTDQQAKAFYQQFHTRREAYYIWKYTLQFLSKIDTYRFYKYCTLPILKLAIERFQITNEITEDNFNIAFEEIFKSIEVAYTPEKNEEAKNIAYFKYNSKYFIYHDIEMSCASDVFSCIPESMKTINEIMDAYNCSAALSEEGNYTVMAYNKIADELKEKCKPKIITGLEKLKKEYLRQSTFVESEDAKTELIIDGF